MVTPAPLELNADDSMAFLTSATARLAHTGRAVKLKIVVTLGSVSAVCANAGVIHSDRVVSVSLDVRSGLHRLLPLRGCQNKIVSISVAAGVWSPGRLGTAGALGGLIGNSLVEFISPGNAHAQLGDLKRSIETLQVLRVQSSGIRNLNFIERFQGLIELDVSDNVGIRRLFALNSLPNLKNLNLSGCAVQSLTPLGEHNNLHNLDISRTQVVNLGPLKTCPALRTVRVAAGDHGRLLASYLTSTGAGPHFVIEQVP
jgi:hypothetical protein